MQLTAMLRAADAEGRWSGQDAAALARQFHQFVADSAAYMVGVLVGIGTVSYTHLDVYKRQPLICSAPAMNGRWRHKRRSVL